MHTVGRLVKKYQKSSDVIYGGSLRQKKCQNTIWPAKIKVTKNSKIHVPSLACRYKVWYLEICDPVEKKQVVHLILAEGGTNCEIVRHKPKDCVPSKENDHPIMPQKATFKELLLSKNHSMAALEDTIKKTVSFLFETIL